jgi:ABC-type phosphonate transport system ATPase subunit
MGHMINVSNATPAYGKKVLFKDVHIKFTPGNGYGVVGLLLTHECFPLPTVARLQFPIDGV